MEPERWSNQPEVTNSGLLPYMSQQEIAYFEKKYAILTYQKKLLNDLSTTQQRLQTIQNYIPQESFSVLSKSFVHVHRGAFELATSLEVDFQEDPMQHKLPQVFVNNMIHLSAYLGYLKSWQNVSSVLDAIHRIPAQQIRFQEAGLSEASFRQPLNHLQELKELLHQMAEAQKAFIAIDHTTVAFLRMIDQLADDSVKLQETASAAAGDKDPLSDNLVKLGINPGLQQPHPLVLHAQNWVSQVCKSEEIFASQVEYQSLCKAVGIIKQFLEKYSQALVVVQSVPDRMKLLTRHAQTWKLSFVQYAVLMKESGRFALPKEAQYPLAGITKLKSTLRDIKDAELMAGNFGALKDINIAELIVTQLIQDCLKEKVDSDMGHQAAATLPVSLKTTGSGTTNPSPGGLANTSSVRSPPIAAVKPRPKSDFEPTKTDLRMTQVPTLCSGRSSAPAGETNLSDVIKKYNGQIQTWQDMPDVVKSGNLKSLTPDMVKLHEIQFEFLTTEANFIHTLEVNEQFYCKAIQNSAAIPDDDFNELFNDIKIVRKSMTQFVLDMDLLYQSNCMGHGLFQQVLLVHVEKLKTFDILRDYAGVYPRIEKVFDTMMAEDRRFNALVADLENNTDAPNVLSEYFIQPINRTLNLKKLIGSSLEVMKKVGDNQKEIEVVNFLCTYFVNLAHTCNKAKAISEDKAVLKRIHKQAFFRDYLEPTVIAKHNRQILFHGEGKALRMTNTFPFSTVRTTKIYLLLCSDVLFIAKINKNSFLKQKEDKIYKIVDHCDRSTVKIKQIPKSLMNSELESYNPLQITYRSTKENKQDSKNFQIKIQYRKAEAHDDVMFSESA